MTNGKYQIPNAKLQMAKLGLLGVYADLNLIDLSLPFGILSLPFAF
jgi:hypothetical protein